MGVSVLEYYRLQREGRTGDLSFTQFNARFSETEKRSTLTDDSWWFRNVASMFNQNSASVSVNSYNAMGLTAYKRCVELRATGQASLKLRLIKTANGTKEVVLSHPSIDVLRNPNQYQTAYEWRKWMESLRVGRGNSYSYIKRNTSGKPIGLVPIWNPDEVSVSLINGDIYYNYNGQIKEIPTQIPGYDMIHLRGMTWENPLVGMSPIAYHAERLGIAIASEKSSGTTYRDNRLKFAISSSENIKPDQQKFLKNTLTDVLTGESDSLVLPPNGKIETLTLSPKDADFISNSQLTVNEIGRMFGVPNSMLNVDGGTKGSTEQDGLNFFNNTLYPDAISAEQEFAVKLLAENEKANYSFDHTFNSMKLADATTRADVYEKLRRQGVINANYIADSEEIPRPENGEIYFTDSNLVPTSQFEAWIDSKIQQNLNKQNPNPNGNN